MRTYETPLIFGSTMRVLFATGNAYLPQMSGGVQSSTHQLALRLIRSQYDVGVLCRLWYGGWTEFHSRVQRRLTGRKFSSEESLGYTVYRAWEPADTREIVGRFHPDVAVVQQGHDTIEIAKSLEEQGIPVVVYLRNVELHELDGDPGSLASAYFIANSNFTASRYRQSLGVESVVIPPLIDRSLYETLTKKENVAFINPNQQKGLDMALSVARACPHIPFSFVESWPIPDDDRKVLNQELSNLPNVTLVPRTNDMKQVYGLARILLAPSSWEEAWGRVASEAHCSGIPVIGSNRGGLPEAIGPGGIVLDYQASVDEWAAAVNQVWEDDVTHARLSRAAIEYSRRPQLNEDAQFQMFLEVLEKARRRGHTTHHEDRVSADAP